MSIQPTDMADTAIERPNAAGDSPDTPNSATRPSWRFVRRWTLVTTLAVAVWTVAIAPFSSVVVDWLEGTLRQMGIWWYGEDQFVTMTTIAAVVGLAQWLLLRQKVPRAYLWPVVAVGVAAVGALPLNPPFYLPLTFLLIGLLHGLILTRRPALVAASAAGVVGSGVVAIVVGFIAFIGAMVIAGQLDPLRLRDDPWLMGGYVALVFAAILLSGAVYGFGTGLTVDYVLRKNADVGRGTVTVGDVNNHSLESRP